MPRKVLWSVEERCIPGVPCTWSSERLAGFKKVGPERNSQDLPATVEVGGVSRVPQTGRGWGATTWLRLKCDFDAFKFSTGWGG